MIIKQVRIIKIFIVVLILFVIIYIKLIDSSTITIFILTGFTFTYGIFSSVYRIFLLHDFQQSKY